MRGNLWTLWILSRGDNNFGVRQTYFRENKKKKEKKEEEEEENEK